LSTAEALIFKGTIGTGGNYNNVPTNGYLIGYTYKAVSNVSIGSGANAIQCENGDLVIAIADAGEN